MDAVQRKAIYKAIMYLLGLIVAAIMGNLIGCSLSWKPDHITGRFLWPDRPVELKLQVGGTTQPAEDLPE